MSQIIDSEMNIGNLSLLEKKKKSLSDKNLKMKLTEANLTVCKVHWHVYKSEKREITWVDSLTTQKQDSKLE